MYNRHMDRMELCRKMLMDGFAMLKLLLDVNVIDFVFRDEIRIRRDDVTT